MDLPDSWGKLEKDNKSIAGILPKENIRSWSVKSFVMSKILLGEKELFLGY